MKTKSVLVAGANQGALAFACFAAEKGFSVTVYEKKRREDVSYEWCDDMNASTFEKTGIERPHPVISGTTPGAVFLSPNKKCGVKLPDEANSSDIPVNRRELNGMLYSRAVNAGVIFRYECAVDSVLHNDSGVYGVKLKNGESILSDFTVDCTGANSVLRQDLPDSFLIPQKICDDDMFFVTRTYYERTEKTLSEQISRKIYLKHLNERGISWCFPSYDGKSADVLIGRLGKLDEATQKRAFSDLKSENPIIGETVLFGGEVCTIPVRRPISRMIANGFALLGDSAYMTIPMNGSGIARSLLAAKILADVISAPVEQPFGIENLYNYQLRYMHEIGAQDAPVELIKNMLLNSGDGDVDFLMQKGIINAQVLGGIQGKPDFALAVRMIKSVLSGLGRPGLLLSLLKTIIKMGSQTKITMNMPSAYSEAEFVKWQQNYEKAYQK